MSDPPAGEPALDIAVIVETLNQHRVAYVVIGGVASQAWATSLGVDIRPTLDIDVTPDTDQVNLQRLSDALHELGARIRSEADPNGLLFDHDGVSLGRATIWNLICPAGPFDLSFIPSGTDGYSDLVRNARVVVVEGIETPLADLADVVRSKRAANRPKDLEVLPALEEALRRRDDQIVHRNRESGDLTVSFEIKVVGGDEGKLLQQAQDEAIRDLIQWSIKNQETAGPPDNAD